MAATIGFLGDMTNISLGPESITFITLAPDASYPTGGYALTAVQLKVGSPLTTAAGIAGIAQIGCNTAALGYSVFWNTQTGKFQIATSAGFTPAGTNSAPTISMAGSGGGGAVTVNPEANAGALVHNAAGTITGITGVQAPVFTGTAVAAAAEVEVANLTDLHTLLFTLIAFGLR